MRDDIALSVTRGAVVFESHAVSEYDLPCHLVPEFQGQSRCDDPDFRFEQARSKSSVIDASSLSVDSIYRVGNIVSMLSGCSEIFPPGPSNRFAS